MASPLQITVKNRPEGREPLARALAGFALEHALPSKALQAADLVLEEHLTNVFTYAFEDELIHEIVVRLTVDAGWMRIEVEDEGKPFDPLSQPPVDTSVPLEQKPIGGLGIHLMRQFMDEVEYQRTGGKNILRMGKRLDR